MNIKNEFLEHCKKMIKGHANPELLETPPNNISDLALPCFSLSKKFKKNPVEIAAHLAEKLNKIKKPALVREIKAVGPYVNFYIDNEKFSQLAVKEILRQKSCYGSGRKKREKIMVEFSHPNTHKAFHIGHVRNISLGESICRILEFNGHKVFRTNYQGDIGPHVAKCIWGYMNLELKEPEGDMAEKGKWLGVIYADASKKSMENLEIAEQIADINKKIYSADKKIIAIWKKTRSWSLHYFDKIYGDFGTKFDKLYFESQTAKPGIKIVKSLLKTKKAKMSEGAVIAELGEKLGNFVILKSDKTPLYSTKDLGLVQMEFKDFKPDRILHVVADEQDLYFRQLFELFKLINKSWFEKSMHLSYGLVILKGGKMSSREGDVILYDDLLEKLYFKALEMATEKNQSNTKETAREIALAAIKYAMLKIDSHKTITFDWEEALSIEGDTGPYLQYTHARANSILHKASPKKNKVKRKPPALEDKEILLIKKLSDFPSIVEKSCKETKPNILANYLHELAALFNEFYQTTRVIGSDNEKFRLDLVLAFKTALANGLNLLGITPLDKI